VLTSSPLDCHRTTPFVRQKVLQCSEQIGTKPSLFLAHGSQTSALQQVREKSLGQILCLLRTDALSLHTAINRTPINAAEFLERFLCCRRFRLCLQHDAPVCGSKRHGPLLSGFRPTSPA